MRIVKSFLVRYNRVVRKLKFITHPRAIIVKPEGNGEKVSIYMNECIEKVQMIPVYSFINCGSFEVSLPEIALWKFHNGLLFGDSDMIILQNERAIFPKYYNYNYNKSIVTDSNFIDEQNGILSYKVYKKRKHFKTVFSLLGKFSHIWAHALVEYYPKISMLKYAVEDSAEKITVLVPEYKDPQLKEIIYEQLNRFNVEIVTIQKGITIDAETIYYMERPTKFTDHEVSVAIGDQLIPKKTVEVVRNMLVEPRTKRINVDERYKRIFLPRRGGIGKGIVNGQEIEDYFKSEGFYFVEPHKITFEEKIRLFQSAEYIVGPFGSAFTNLIFCKPGTKVLILSNYQRLFENYFSMPLQYYGVDIHYVTGYDIKTQNPAHCSFYISLDKVKDASTIYGLTNG